MSQRITVRPRIWPSHKSESPSSEPTTSSASLSAAARCRARSRIDAPTESGCDSSTTPLPFTVVATGAPSASASAVTSACASTAPPPAMIIGWVAAASSSAARRTWPGSACGAATAVQTRGSPDQVCSSTSIGISMCTGRGRRPVKVPNASVTAAAASSALRTRRLQRTSWSIAPLGFLASCSWPRSRPSVPVGKPDESRSIGCDSP